jgi:hypothetical protein
MSGTLQKKLSLKTLRITETEMKLCDFFYCVIVVAITLAVAIGLLPDMAHV